MLNRRQMLGGALTLLAAPATAQPPPPSASPIDELMRRLATVQETRANFVEEKTIAALTAPLRSEGQLFYRRPGHLEKITTAPVPESLMVDGDRLSIVAANQEAKLVELDGQPAIRCLVDAVRGTLSGSLPTLRRSYDVGMQGTLSDWRLVLTPASDELARLLRQVSVEGSGTSLRSVSIEQANGDRSVMTIRAAG